MRIEAEFYETFGRVGRVIPSFFVLALFGCLTGYFFGVPLEDLAVVVAVPLVVAFAISRVPILFLPVPPVPAPPIRRPPMILRTSMIAAILSAGGAVVFSLSAAVYWKLGLWDAEATSVKVAVTSLVVVVVSVIFTLASAFVARNMEEFLAALETGILKLLACPTRIADKILPPRLGKQH